MTDEVKHYHGDSSTWHTHRRGNERHGHQQKVVDKTEDDRTLFVEFVDEIFFPDNAETFINKKWIAEYPK